MIIASLAALSFLLSHAWTHGQVSEKQSRLVRVREKLTVNSENSFLCDEGESQKLLVEADQW